MDAVLNTGPPFIMTESLTRFPEDVPGVSESTSTSATCRRTDTQLHQSYTTQTQSYRVREREWGSEWEWESKTQHHRQESEEWQTVEQNLWEDLDHSPPALLHCWPLTSACGTDPRCPCSSDPWRRSRTNTANQRLTESTRVQNISKGIMF